jgi:hypothetical protein
MKFQLILGAAALASLAGTALPLTERERAQAVVKYLDRGRHELGRARLADTRAAKLILLDDAAYALRRARSEALRAKSGEVCDLQPIVDRSLVTVLDDQAEIYYIRGSHPKAMKRVVEALDIIPDEPRTLALYARLAGSQASGSSTFFGGIPATNRANERRGFGAAPITPAGTSTVR